MGVKSASEAKQLQNEQQKSQSHLKKSMVYNEVDD
jgi:hypothetical protein